MYRNCYRIKRNLKIIAHKVVLIAVNINVLFKKLNTVFLSPSWKKVIFLAICYVKNLFKNDSKIHIKVITKVILKNFKADHKVLIKILQKTNIKVNKVTQVTVSISSVNTKWELLVHLQVDKKTTKRLKLVHRMLAILTQTILLSLLTVWWDWIRRYKNSSYHMRRKIHT